MLLGKSFKKPSVCKTNVKQWVGQPITSNSILILLQAADFSSNTSPFLVCFLNCLRLSKSSRILESLLTSILVSPTTMYLSISGFSNGVTCLSAIFVYFRGTVISKGHKLWIWACPQQYMSHCIWSRSTIRILEIVQLRDGFFQWHLSPQKLKDEIILFCKGELHTGSIYTCILLTALDWSI